MLANAELHPCLCCGARQGVDVVRVFPVDERAARTDRRVANQPERIPATGDRRVAQRDRRVRNQIPPAPPTPQRECLACAYQWELEPALA